MLFGGYTAPCLNILVSMIILSHVLISCWFGNISIRIVLVLLSPHHHYPTHYHHHGRYVPPSRLHIGHRSKVALQEAKRK
jgi:hypothetical protein